MIKRGLKRKATASAEDAENGLHLRNYQNATRRRESMRIKNNVLSKHPGAFEKHLKDKVAVEMSLVEGTAKFIFACKNKAQTLEAGKTLLVARLRCDMLKFELNKLRRGRGSPVGNEKQGKPSYAGVSLSDIRIPLMWRRKDHINDIGDPRCYAIFCIARIGSQIYDTALIEPVDRHSTDITLPDVILFSKVPNYFEITIEVYSHILEDKDLGGIASTPQKIARSISRAVGKNLGKQMKDFENIGPKFHLIASATLNLDNCSDDTRTHELYVEEDPSGDDDGTKTAGFALPLFGQFCCRLAALPYCCEEEVLSGHLSLKRNAGQTTELWAALSDWKLSLWTERERQEEANAFLVIPINRDTRIEDEGHDTLTIINRKIPFEFHFEDKENLHNWLVHLIQHAADHRRWKEAASTRMEVLSPKNMLEGAPTMGRPLKRTRSKLVMLYNEAGN